MYYRGAAAAIVVYDITRSNTFKTLRNWVEELKTQGPKDIALAIAGNKADLADRRVTICCLALMVMIDGNFQYRKLIGQLRSRLPLK